MEDIYSNIIDRLKEFQERNHVKGYVIGISSGKDSTVVAKLLVDAIGKENVLGVLMPNGEQKDIEDSIKVCELLGINYHTVNIRCIYNSLLSAIHEPQTSQTKMIPDIDGTWYPETEPQDRKATTENGFEFQVSPKAHTNIPPRLRMSVLYAIAQSIGYLVAGTGNKSERFVGWFTKWGDGACDINPIAHLTCTEVIALGDYLGLPYDLVHKTPADGLTGKSDEENLGFTYKELDSLIKKTESSDYYILKNQKEKDILSMHYNSFHKFKPITFE
jgi:NAD+ synthase